MIQEARKKQEERIRERQRVKTVRQQEHTLERGWNKTSLNEHVLRLNSGERSTGIDYCESQKLLKEKPRSLFLTN